MTSILVMATVAFAGAQATNIDSYIQTTLKDATFLARVVKGDQKELGKINKDFGQMYRFSTITTYLKEPLKVRLEAHVEDADALYIINGPDLKFRVGPIKGHQDLSKAPGRRQTTMDVGILTPAIFQSLLDAKFVHSDRETGNPVFDLTYKPALDDTSRNRVWIDKTRHILVKREWYNQYNRLLATFFYLNPKEINGVWVPTRLEVKNTDNVVAGIMNYDTLKVNTGLADSMFTTK